MAKRPFLTAEWLNVAAITFAAEEERLRPYLPRGATIDTLEGSPRVSLVAFEFRRTRVHGLAIPRHVDFPEINLRFYVRYGGERGVVFIRELVPRLAIVTVAHWSAAARERATPTAPPTRCAPPRRSCRARVPSLVTLARELEREIGEAPVALPDADAEPLLSAAEQRVLELLPTDLTYREIADRLDLSLNTVRTHGQRIRRKLGASTRDEAVAAAPGCSNDAGPSRPAAGPVLAGPGSPLN